MRSQADIRQNVTEQIIESLKNGGLPPWRKTWSDDPNAPGLHTSLSTGQPYRGINQLILQCAAIQGGFKSRWWGTFNQIRHQNASVRRTEKGHHVILWKPICRKRINEDGKEIDENFLIMREFVVFNAEQTTDLRQFRVGYCKPKSDPIGRYEEADHVIDSTDAQIEYGGNRACYRPDDDVIQMPFRHQFETPEAFYETAFHELVQLNPGDWFGKCWLLEIGGSYTPLFLVVEADSVQDAIDELADNDRYGHLIIVDEADLDDYPDEDRHYGPSGQVLDLDWLMVHGQEGSELPFPCRYFGDGLPEEGMSPADYSCREDH